MDGEVYKLEVDASGARHGATAELLPATNAHLRLKFLDRKFEATSYDYFDALRQIRRELEKEGVRVICYGASRNVWPSGMSSQMGGGLKAYKTYMGQQGRMADLVEIFDAGPDLDLSTVDEQQEFHEAWGRSFGTTR